MIVKIAWRNMLHKPLSTLLSWLLLSVSVGIISLLLQLQQQLEQQFTGNIKNVDMVIGAKGSPLQLILSAVYHIDAPTGNIRLQEAEKWMDHPFVESAIPLAYGDSYQGYSIVGTTHAFLDKYSSTIATGRMYENDFEVVAGTELARKLNLKVGSRLYSTHGDEHGEEHVGNFYTVTGILAYTGRVVDNLLLCNVESIWKMHAHEEQETDHKTEKIRDDDHGEDHDAKFEKESEEHAKSEKELTAILIKFRDPMGYMQLPRMINEQSNMMAAIPSIEVNRLFTMFGVGIDTLKSFGWGIMALSALSVFVALFNSLKERKYELALMRTMGAGRSKLLVLLLLEGMILCVAGIFSGLLLARVGLWIISGGLEKNYHIQIQNWSLQWPEEFWLMLLTLSLGILAAIVPAIKAWFINISKTLADG